MNPASNKGLAVLACVLLCMASACVKRVMLPSEKSDDTIVIDRKEFLAIARQNVADSVLVPDSILFKPDVMFPGDQIGITLYEKLPVSMEKRLEIKRIDGRGMVFLLPMGTIKLGGMTTNEAERFLEGKLQEYFVSPHVEIAITEREIGKEQVYLFGAAGRQGSFELKDNYRILDLFAEAGGVSSSILARPVKLIRVKGEKIVMTTINLNDIFRRGQIDKNIPLQNQDIVYVPQPFFGATKEILGVVSTLLPWYYYALLFSGTR
jgi:protein involved in polysaccharide export with SLBB domain